MIEKEFGSLEEACDVLNRWTQVKVSYGTLFFGKNVEKVSVMFDSKQPRFASFYYRSGPLSSGIETIDLNRYQLLDEPRFLVGELGLKGKEHREAVELFVAICERYANGEEIGRTREGLPIKQRQTVYLPYNPPSERGEIYLSELERAGLIRVQYEQGDPALGSSHDGTTVIAEPTKEGLAMFEYLLEQAGRKN